MGINGLLTDVRWEWTGTELTADLLTGVTVLPVLDPTSISEGESVWIAMTGPYEIVDADEDGLTFTIAPGLEIDVDSGTEVANDIGGQPGRAWVCEVVLADADTPVEVPLTIHDLAVMPEGTYDPPVTIVLSDDLERVENLPGSMPVIDGVYIPSDSLPIPPLSDGDAPALSPAASVIGGIGAIFVQWNAITNPDAVTYEVHLSKIDGFTPDGTTLATELAGTSTTLRTMPDGSPLTYLEADGTTQTVYFARVVAKDVDGAAPPGTQGSGSMMQVTGPDVAADYVYAGTIVAEQIRGGTIISDVLVSANLRTAESGQRVEINSTGISLWAPDNVSVLASLPTDPTLPASLKGMAELDQTIINGNFTMRGVTNELSPASALSLAGKVTDPTSPPTPQITWDSVLPWIAENPDLDFHGLTWHSGFGLFATANWFFGSQLLWFDASGAFGGNCQLPEHSTSAWFNPVGGAVYHGGTNCFFVIGICGDDDFKQYWETRKYSLNVANPRTAPATLVNHYRHGLVGSQFPNKRPCIGLNASGSGVILAWATSANQIVWAEVDTTTCARGTAFAISPVAGAHHIGDMGFVQRSSFDLGADTFMTATVSGGTRIFAGYAGGVRTSQHDFPINGNSTLVGACYGGPGGKFYGIDQGGRLTTYTDNKWTTESSKWHASYVLKDTDAAGTGTHTTGQSTKASFTMSKRAVLTLTSPTIPDNGGSDDPDSVAFYLGRGAAPPAATGMYLNGAPAPAIRAVTLRSVSFAGSTAPASNFPSSGAAKIVDALGQTLIDALGYSMFAPTGVVEMYAGASAPTGWLICDGTAVSRTAYSALFAVIGTAFGTGDGSTTFNLPDMRDRFPVGVSGSKALGTTGGAATHVHQMAAHTHDLSTSANGTIGGVASRVNASSTGGMLTTPDTGSGSSLPPYRALNYLIKT